MFSLTSLSHYGFDKWTINSAFAQLTNNTIPIQIISTSTYVDDIGNFHVIGEVNNTSVNPQTNVMVTALLSDTNNNLLVGNYSSFSSIGTLRQGELSPFDILIQDPQILGKFNFMEFSTTSQPTISEKPGNLLLNGSNSFLDNVGNPHIVGSIINQRSSPEQFLNLVVTFYDNSSLGVVGTQSFGLNVGNLSNNQVAPFDLTITDNKTKSQAKFYSLNLDSTQNSMGLPLNIKFPFEPLGGFVNSGLFLDSPPNVNPLPLTDDDFNSNNNNNNNNNNDGGSSSDNDNSDQSNSDNDLVVDIDVAKDPISPKHDQTIEVTVRDSDTEKGITGAKVESNVHYASGTDVEEKVGQTNNEGIFDHTWEIGGHSKKGTFKVVVNVEANGYNSQTETTTFEVVDKNDLNNDTKGKDNSTGIEENSTSLTNDGQSERNGDMDCSDVGERNFSVGSSDPNNFDGDGDGIGCESGNNEDDDNSSAQSSNNNTRCDDGFHRSPSGDCERVKDTSGMPRCDDGFHRSPDGDCERISDASESDDNGSSNDDNDSEGEDED